MTEVSEIRGISISDEIKTEEAEIARFLGKVRNQEFPTAMDQVRALEYLLANLPEGYACIFGFFMDFTFGIDSQLVGIFEIHDNSFEKIAAAFEGRRLRFVPTGPTGLDFLDEYLPELNHVLLNNEWAMQGLFLSEIDRNGGVEGLEELHRTWREFGCLIPEWVVAFNRWIRQNGFCMLFAPAEPARVAFFASHEIRPRLSQYLQDNSFICATKKGFCGDFIAGIL